MEKSKRTLAKRKVVDYTKGIPICPTCNKPTKRTAGHGSVTLAYYAPIYDENGVNTNPDRNTRTNHYECLECGNSYVIRGNSHDGYNYG